LRQQHRVHGNTGCPTAQAQDQGSFTPRAQRRLLCRLQAQYRRTGARTLAGGRASAGLRSMPSVEQVPDRQVRVAHGHPWSRVAHDGSDLFAFVRPEAVDGAAGAGGFVCAKGAGGYAAVCVVKEGGAGRAETGARLTFAGGAMIGPAVHSDHRFDGAPLAAQPAGQAHNNSRKLSMAWRDFSCCGPPRPRASPSTAMKGIPAFEKAARSTGTEPRP